MNQNHGIGRRKRARARVILRPNGSGKITINKKECEAFEPSPHKRKLFLEPLEKIPEEAAKKIDLLIRTEGGGISGRLGAIRLGIARALVEMNVTFRENLKEPGFLKRDARKKERKKAGLKKARKAPQFSKR